MSVGDDRGQSGTHYEGKGVVIVLVVLFSSLSFTLGFFVGKKSTADYPMAPAVQSVAQSGVLQGASVQDMQSAGSNVSSGSETPQPEPDKEYAQAASPETSASPSRSAEGDREETPHAPKRLTEKASKRNPRDTMASADAAAANFHQDGTVYSVQLGALKNAAEARRLKEKYAKKGYNTSITVTRLNNRDKVYKVKAGAFRDRKDAELLALKLKKNEGIHAFVTLNND